MKVRQITGVRYTPASDQVHIEWVNEKGETCGTSGPMSSEHIRALVARYLREKGVITCLFNS
jgi:hypothetical protein